MIELERTFLVKKIPDLSKARKVEMVDVYIPKSHEHPTLRIRKNGTKYEMTKKMPVGKDPSVQKEQTIILNKEEFDILSKLDGKRTEKNRYVFEVNGRICEIDIFRGRLKGLVLADFEFQKEDEKSEFKMPCFCLADVTKEKFLAGGMLCGKSYDDIKDELKRFGYAPLV